MANVLTIELITKLSNGTYKVDFTSNFNPSSLSYEYSSDNITWSTPIAFSNTTSPKNIAVPDLQVFYVRLKNTQTITAKKHNNKFNSKFN